MKNKKKKNFGIVFEEDLNIKHLNKKPKTKVNKIIKNKNNTENTITNKQTIIIDKSKEKYKNKFKWFNINLNDLIFVLILLSGFFFGLYYLKDYLKLNIFNICIIEMISLVFAYLSNLVSKRYLFLLIPLISKFSLYKGYSIFFKGFSYDLNLLFYHFKKLNLRFIVFILLIALYFFKKHYFIISLIIIIIAIVLDYFIKTESKENKSIIKIYPFQSFINGLISISPLIMFKLLNNNNNFIFIFLIFGFLFYFVKYENQRINFLILSLALLLFYLGFNNIYLIIVYLFAYSNLMFIAFNNSLNIKDIKLNLESQLFIFSALISMLVFVFFKKYLLFFSFFVVLYNVIALKYLLKHKNEKKA